MAREFNLLRLLLVVACLAVPTTTTEVSTKNTTAVTTTTTTAVTIITPAVPTNNTTAVTTTTTTAVPTTTTAVRTTNTTAVPTNNTTEVPTTNTTAVTTITTTAVTITTTTAGPTTTMLPNPCNENSCGAGATCEPRADQTFACLCLTGDFYNNISKTCDSAKVFPGKLVLQIAYKEGMVDKKSPEFLKASITITDELSQVFKLENGYSGSIVLKLSQVPKVGNPGYSEVTSTFWSRASIGVSADVQIIFEANADIVTDAVTAELVKQKDCENCLLKNSFFVGRELCVESDTPCGQTTACTSGNGTYTCICLPGYITTIYSERICIACPSGQTSVESSNTCVVCPFGYSGFKCGDSWKLSLVIVGSVLGALLLITLIVLIVVAVRSTKKKSCKKSKKADTGNSYVSQLPVKAPLGAHSHVAPANGLGNGQSAFGNAGVPRIPRATTTSSLDNRTNLEMTQSNSRQNLIPAGRNSRFYEDNEDQYAQSRQSSLYARPQNTPYSQSRPQNNPYAQSQGHSSPYMH